MKTAQEKLEWEMQAYGMSEAALKDMLAKQALPGTEMIFAAGLLSDAQMIISGEMNEDNDGWVSPQEANRARQWMNIAKFIMFTRKAA